VEEKQYTDEQIAWILSEVESAGRLLKSVAATGWLKPRFTGGWIRPKYPEGTFF